MLFITVIQIYIIFRKTEMLAYKFSVMSLVQFIFHTIVLDCRSKLTYSSIPSVYNLTICPPAGVYNSAVHIFIILRDVISS